jgi:imidazoleglycerol phosphate synthase glutamine amidotransferase subunit HisH
MGWNTVRIADCGLRIAEGISDITSGQSLAPNNPHSAGLPYFYFVHSYYVEPAAEAAGAVVGTTTYGRTFCSVLVQDRLWATQFHPEKSGPIGLRLLANWVNQLRDEETHGYSTGD